MLAQKTRANCYWYVRVSTPIVSIYAESPRCKRERFAIFLEYDNSNCREMNISSNKAYAYFSYLAQHFALVFSFFSVLEIGRILF